MEASGLPPLLVLVGIVGAVVAWQIVRGAVERRLALRDAIRRPGETALVIGGSLLGAALITGSFIVGDTLDKSIRITAHTQLGPVDEVITVPRVKEAPAVAGRLGGIDGVDGVMTLVAVEASFSSDVSGQTLAEPRAQAIELDLAEARDFGGDPEVTGISGPPPGPGEVIVTEDLADTLEVEAGDRITGYLYESQMELEVRRVLARLGIAGFWTGFETSSPNAFVAPGTIAEITADGLPEGAVPPTARVLVSNRGGVEEGGALTDVVAPRIRDALGADLQLRVDEVKKDRLEQAEVQGKEFSELFLGIGAFAIVAGILLLVNIFVMLAEERKSQLGMLRAIGMRRSGLVRGFLIEGSIYALLSSALGAFLGIGVGWAIVIVAAPIFGGFGDFSIDLAFRANPASVVGGFCIGVLISFATITFTSVRIARINIIRAIRDLPEPRMRITRTRTLVVGALLAALGAAWFVTALRDDQAWASALLGPPLVAFGLLPTLTRMAGRRTAVLGVSAFSLFWGIFGNAILGNQFFESGEIFAFVAQGILLTFAAVVLLSQSQETLEGGIRRVAARYLSLRLGLAYPLARRFRTGLTLGMYSLVIFTMIFISVLSNVFGGQVEVFTKRAAGGFDVTVRASETNPPTAEQIASVDGVERVATIVHGVALWLPLGAVERPSGSGLITATSDQPDPWPVSGIDESFVDGGPPRLEEMAVGLDSAAAVWARVLADPEVVIIPEFFLQTGGGPPGSVVEPGDTLAMIDPVTNESVEREVIATLGEDTTFLGVIMSRSSLEGALRNRVAPTRFFIQTDTSESESRRIATAIQGAFVANGAEAETFMELTEEFLQLNLQFFRLMQGYLALGLIVGIAGLGVLMVRAVRERRREIGVLRSLGFLAPRVRRAFLLESGFVALEGILVGSVLALITSAQLVSTGEFGEGIEFMIPWGQVVVVCGSALVASLLATAWPAQQASTIPPAVALRVAE